MANALEQIGAVTAMNLRNIPQRWSSSLVAVLGIGGVTLVLVALLSIGAGFSKALEGSGSDDVALIMRSGATSEMQSYFGADQITALNDVPSIMRNANKEPMISPEVFGVVAVPLRGKDSDGNLPLRGVGPLASQLRKALHPRRGTHVQAGQDRAHRRHRRGASSTSGLDVGSKVRWLNTDWQVVGRFTDDGGLAESEVWADAPVVQQAWQRGPVYQTVRAKLAEGSIAQGTQGRAHEGSALHRGRPQREAVLRRSAEGLSNAHQQDRPVDRHHHGTGGVVRRVEHAGERGREPRARNRHAARHGIWRGTGGDLGARGSHDPRRHRRTAGRVMRLSVPQWHHQLDAELRVVQPDHVRVHRHAAAHVAGYRLRAAVVPAGRYPAGRSCCAAADYAGICANCEATFFRNGPGRWHLAGASSFSRAQRAGGLGRTSKGASSTRTTPTTRVPSTACSIRSSPSPSKVRTQARRRMRPTRSYFRALTHYRLAQVLAVTQEVAGANEPSTTAATKSTTAIDALPKVPTGLDESRRGAASARRGLCARHGLHAGGPRDELAFPSPAGASARASRKP